MISTNQSTVSGGIWTNERSPLRPPQAGLLLDCQHGSLLHHHWYLCKAHQSPGLISKVWLSVSFWCFGFCCLSQLSQSPAVPRSVQSELLSFNKVFRFMIQTDCFVLSLTCESNTTTKIFLRNLSFIISSCHFSVFRHNIRTLESRSRPGQYKNQLLFPSFLPPHWLYFFSLFPKDVRWYIQLQLVMLLWITISL